VVQSDEQIIQVVLEITECYLEEGGSGSQAFTAMSPTHFMCARLPPTLVSRADEVIE